MFHFDTSDWKWEKKNKQKDTMDIWNTNTIGRVSCQMNERIEL